MAGKEYSKLTPLRNKPGFKIISTSRSNLWLGSDHLLSVETEGYTESYRRFYFKDIQAFILHKSRRQMMLSLVLGFFTTLFTLIVLVNDAIELKIVFSIVALLFGIPLVLNLALGPTCNCDLRTAVQTERIPSMGRLRRARKVLTRIRPLIAEAQGALTPEEISSRFRALQTGVPEPAGSNPTDAPPVIGELPPTSPSP